MQPSGTVEIPNPEYPYADAIGIAPEDLPSGVRISHQSPLTAQGIVWVKRHPNRLVNWLMMPLRFPGSGDSIKIHLKITSESECINWIRKFGDRTMLTVHRIINGEVSEDYGIVSMRFHLDWSDATLHYRQVGFRIAGIPIPRKIAPKTSAEVTPVEGEVEAWEVHVCIRIPLFGVVCEYGGKLCPQ